MGEQVRGCSVWPHGSGSPSVLSPLQDPKVLLKGELGYLAETLAKKRFATEGGQTRGTE